MDKVGSFLFYVGTYTNAESEGIYQCALSTEGTLINLGLVARSTNPSFLAKSHDGKFLFAVNEVNKNNTGTIESFLISDKDLSPINYSHSGGADPCFISVNAQGFILVSNYNGGSVGLLRHNSEGKLSTLLDLQQHNGSDIADRQQEAHAHSSWFTPWGNDIISLDLGTNEVLISSLDTKDQNFLSGKIQKFKMKPGAGPRHLAVHPNNKWIYILNELNSSITRMERNTNSDYEVSDSISTLPNNFQGSNLCAEIKISSDGMFLYASNRGHDTIATFKINPDDGLLLLSNFYSTHGIEPRNFALSPDDNYIVVANQQTNNIISFKRNKVTGSLIYVSEIKAYNPVCILF